MNNNLFKSFFYFHFLILELEKELLKITIVDLISLARQIATGMVSSH